MEEEEGRKKMVSHKYLQQEPKLRQFLLQRVTPSSSFLLLRPPPPSAALWVEAKAVQCKHGICVYGVLHLQLQLEPQFPRLSNAGCYVKHARFTHQPPERQKNCSALPSTPSCMYVYDDGFSPFSKGCLLRSPPTSTGLAFRF